MTAAPASFGDVTGEYLALRDGSGFVTGAHEVVWADGPDAVSFLDGLLSQSIGPMEPGTGAHSLLLGPQGKLRATLWVLRDAERVGMLCDAGRGSVVMGDLQRFLLRVEVSLSLDERPVLDVIGPGTGDVLAAAGLPVPPSTGWLSAAGVVVASVPFWRSTLSRYVVIGADADLLVTAGARPVGSQAASTVRIEAGEPVMGIDLGDGTIPQEGAVVEGAVDFSKGCYLGQELVARIDSRGRVNRHLRGLVVTENVLPPVGAVVASADAELGSVSSVGESLELRAPVGLALLRREAEPGEEVEIRWEGGATSARVAELPLIED